MLRHPRTVQERRVAAGAQTDLDFIEYGIRTRGRRGVATLPTNYDDVPKSRTGDRSWKHRRRNKWR